MEQAIGAAVGSSIGLVALLIGALFNAYLQRRRDDRLRRAEQRALAAALFADLHGALHILQDRYDMLLSAIEQRMGDGYPYRERLRVPPLLCDGLLRERLPLLPHSAAKATVLAFRGHEMIGMLIDLTIAELERGSLDPNLARSRVEFFRAFVTTIGGAMAALARVAGLHAEWRAIKEDKRWVPFRL